jgi:hypothetical protein
MIDQETYDLVRRITLATCKRPVRQFLGVNSVQIVGGNLALDESSVQSLPAKIEERIFSAINCSPTQKEWSRTIRIETKKSVSTEMSKAVSSSNEYKVGVSLGRQAAKFNGDIVSKNSVSVTTKDTQSFSETVIEDIPEKRTIPPNTALYVKTVTTKGLISGEVVGQVIIDASVKLEVDMGAFILTKDFQLTNASLFNAEPQYRTTDLKGRIYSEGYERTDIVYKEKPLPVDDPVCSFFRTSELRSEEGLFEPEVGLVPSERSVGHERSNENLSIRIHNDDLADLFVWVWDLNTFSGDLVLDAVRLNEDDSVDIEVQGDSDDNGRIAWRAVRADDSDAIRQVDELEVSDGDRVDVTTRFG